MSTFEGGAQVPIATAAVAAAAMQQPAVAPTAYGQGRGRGGGDHPRSRGRFTGKRDAAQSSDRRSEAKRRTGLDRPIVASPDGARRCKVAASSDVKAVAGYIAHGIRAEGSPRVYVAAAGPAAINQAIKALALARSYLNADPARAAARLELVASPNFVENTTRSMSNELELELSSLPLPEGVSTLANLTVAPLAVSATTVPAKAAGAAAAELRNGRSPRLDAAGSQATTRALKAVWLARTYLAADGNDADCAVSPHFTHSDQATTPEGEALSLLSLFVIKHTRRAPVPAQQTVPTAAVDPSGTNHAQSQPNQPQPQA